MGLFMSFKVKKKGQSHTKMFLTHILTLIPDLSRDQYYMYFCSYVYHIGSIYYKQLNYLVYVISNSFKKHFQKILGHFIWYK